MNAFFKEYIYGLKCCLSFTPMPMPIIMLLPTVCGVYTLGTLDTLQTLSILEFVLVIGATYIFMILSITFITTIYDMLTGTNN